MPIPLLSQAGRNTVSGMLRGAREVVPLAVGVAIYGLAFGLLAAQAGMSALQTGVMGTVVFAGSSQIVAVERVLAGAGASAALIAGLALNLRLVLLTASIRDVFVGRPWWQIALGAHLTADENWALLLARRSRTPDADFAYLLGAGSCLLVTWIAASVSGVLFAGTIPEPQALGMDFAFTAAFIAIARSLWRGPGDGLPWIVAIGAVLISTGFGLLEPSWALIVGGLGGAATAARHTLD